MLLRNGELVAFPTETVYGLGACADDAAAVASIYQAKGRPSRNPLIVHIANGEVAQRYGIFSDAAMQLAQKFWPGPLTLVLRRSENCPAAPAVSAGGDTIALRVPAHPVAAALLAVCEYGIAAPSANRSGRISPTQATHVWEEFKDTPTGPAVIIDGGQTHIGIESTVLDCTGTAIRVLRPGSLTLEALEHAGQACMPREENATQEALLSPGLLASHYAPRARVRLNCIELRPQEALLAFGKTALMAPCMRNLSASGDLLEAAHNLYDYLRALDNEHVTAIAVMPIPNEGIGCAINDRLGRAAAPRS